VSMDDDLAQEKDDYKLCAEAEDENRIAAIDDLRFSRLGEQWPAATSMQRTHEQRPILTINRMPAFIRQIVNASRQNKPAIKIKPVDAHADIYTAEIYSSLIKNIETVSRSDVAYDTAVDYAASCGWGYIRVNAEYEYDDSFDMGLRIKRVNNPFSIYGDPFSQEADSSDWNMSYVTELVHRDEFSRRWKGAEEVDWDITGYSGLETPWRDGEEILVAESWKREQVKSKIYRLSDETIVSRETLDMIKPIMDATGLKVVGERDSMTHKVIQRIMTGAEILETNP